MPVEPHLDLCPTCRTPVTPAQREQMDADQEPQETLRLADTALYDQRIHADAIFSD